jgi:hypothetical protein
LLDSNLIQTFINAVNDLKSELLTTRSDTQRLPAIAEQIESQSHFFPMIVDEVIKSKRARLDVWTESKRSRAEQKVFKNDLILTYQLGKHSLIHNYVITSFLLSYFCMLSLFLYAFCFFRACNR